MPKTARARVASPPAGTALARAAWDCLPGRVRLGRDSYPTCNFIGDDCQWKRDILVIGAMAAGRAPAKLSKKQ